MLTDRRNLDNGDDNGNGTENGDGDGANGNTNSNGSTSGLDSHNGNGAADATSAGAEYGTGRAASAPLMSTQRQLPNTGGVPLWLLAAGGILIAAGAAGTTLTRRKTI